MQVWNGTTAVWTLSALAAGSVIGAAFSLPFWFAGEPRPAAPNKAHECVQAHKYLAGAILPAAKTAQCSMQVLALYTSCAWHLPGHYMRGMALSMAVAVATGYQVAKDALGGVLSSENLTLGKRKWKLRRGREDNEGGPFACTLRDACVWCTVKNVFLLWPSLVPVQTARRRR